MNIKRTLYVAGGAVVLAGSVVLGTVAAQSEKAPQLQEQGPEALTVDPSSGADVTTDRLDNVEKDVGDAAVLAAEDGKKLFSLEISKITVARDCPARVGNFRLTPENGTFLILDVEASLDRGISKEVSGSADELFMPLVSQAFSVTDPHGVIDREVASESAWGCLGDDVLAPALVNPGQKVSGKIVLDVPYESGTVVYDPNSNGGWSWPY
ncbi:hypothetical protein [Arthrobacter sp.]|uniref:hypothetical protein n=1 Tax=Arthrobacter sp. TaxID=1667 RepID=UPI003A94D89F